VTHWTDALMKIRFSIRWLLILTAIVAAGCYWWIDRPTIVAERFANALAARNFLAADGLCVDPDRRFVCRALYIFHRSDATPWIMGSSGTMIHPFVVESRILPRSWRDLWRAERRLEMAIRDEPRSNFAGRRLDARLLQEVGKRTETFELTATSSSILPPLERAPIFTDPFAGSPPPK
jgi:hypothetical protein